MKYTRLEHVGELAMQYIGDYPLYASTSGITYDEAIAIAKVLNKDWQAEMVEMAELEKKISKMTPEQVKAELEKEKERIMK